MSVIRKYLRIADNASMTGFREIAESGTANQFDITDLDSSTTYYIDANVVNSRGLSTSAQSNFATAADTTDYLTLTPSAATTLQLNKVSTPSTISFEYKLNSGDWTTWAEDSSGNRSLVLSQNDIVKLRCTASSTWSGSTTRYYQFVDGGDGSARYQVSGSVRTLLDPTDTASAIATGSGLYCLFMNFPLTSAPKLPWTTLGTTCYYQLFKGCIYLTDISNIDISAVRDYPTNACYSMFRGCTSLTALPTITTTKIAGSAFQYFAEGCTALTSISNLHFGDSQMDASRNQCFKGAFANCTALTAGADLSSLANESYWGSSFFEQMYSGCTSLSSATTPNCSSWDTNKFSNWLSGVAASGTLTTTQTLSSLIPLNSTSGCPSWWSLNI